LSNVYVSLVKRGDSGAMGGQNRPPPPPGVRTGPAPAPPPAQTHQPREFVFSYAIEKQLIMNNKNVHERSQYCDLTLCYALFLRCYCKSAVNM